MITGAELSTIGSAIGQRMCRYEAMLNSLNSKSMEIRRAFLSDESTDFNVFIDLNYLIANIFDEYTVSNVSFHSWGQQRIVIDIAEKIINAVGHYRNFFVKHFSKPTSVIMYFSKEVCELRNGLMGGEYRSGQLRKSFESPDPTRSIVAKQVLAAIDLAKSVIEYIPNAHLIVTDKNFDSYAVPTLFASTTGYNIHITNVESMMHVFCDTDVYTSFFLRLGSVDPTFLGYHNAFQFLLKKLAFTPEEVSSLPTYFYRLIYLLTGETKLSVSGIKGVGIGKGLKQLMKAQQAGGLSEKILPEQLSEVLKLSEDNAAIVKRNFTLLNNIEYIFTAKAASGDTVAIQNQLSIKSALGEFDNMNADYFGNRLNISLLFNGENW